jgi:hypothetical protein
MRRAPQRRQRPRRRSAELAWPERPGHFSLHCLPFTLNRGLRSLKHRGAARQPVTGRLVVTGTGDGAGLTDELGEGEGEQLGTVTVMLSDPDVAAVPVAAGECVPVAAGAAVLAAGQ